MMAILRPMELRSAAGMVSMERAPVHGPSPTTEVATALVELRSLEGFEVSFLWLLALCDLPSDDSIALWPALMDPRRQETNGPTAMRIDGSFGDPW
jgi:hypothetical protein